jgi:outer membrane protein assembly factor BamB
MATPWYRSKPLFIFSCLIFPPLGFVLLWTRTDSAVFRKLVFSVGLAVVFVVHLFAFYGLRMEIAGSGMTPIFTFHDPESHFDELEESRSGGDEGTAQAASLPAPALTNASWTDYRGPNRDGAYTAGTIQTEWPSSGLPEVWRQKVGGGYASVVVAEGKVFTIEQRRDEEVAAAYDFNTGKELWTNSWSARFEESMGGPGPRATPTWHEGKVYALGGAGELRVLEAATGKLVWRKNILSENGAENRMWAMSGAPLVVDNKVIVLPGGTSGKSVVAYDKDTGETVWSSLNDKQAYTSPMLVTLAGRQQIILVSALRMLAVDPEDGALLWDYPWKTSYDANCAQPLIVDGEHVFVSSGYGTGAALVKITPDGDGLRAEEIWKNNTMKNKFNSSVLHEGIVYGLDEAILAAVDVRTGERKWKGGRYGFGQVLLAGDHLVILTEAGDVVLVKATPESHQEVARFSAIKGKTWNTHAIAGGRLIVRNQTEMACYDISKS